MGGIGSRCTGAAFVVLGDARDAVEAEEKGAPGGYGLGQTTTAMATAAVSSEGDDRWGPPVSLTLSLFYSFPFSDSFKTAAIP